VPQVLLRTNSEMIWCVENAQRTLQRYQGVQPLEILVIETSLVGTRLFLHRSANDFFVVTRKDLSVGIRWMRPIHHAQFPAIADARRRLN
jgi:hypothetical protein